MKKITFCILLLLWVCSEGSAQDDHLVPADMDYYKKAYPDLFMRRKREEFRYLKLPSWGRIGGFVLESKRTKLVLMGLEKEGGKAEVGWKERKISKDLYQAIRGLFLSAIEGLDFPEREVSGFDGETYYYSMAESKGAFLEGEVWTPGDTSLMGRLGMLFDRVWVFSQDSKGEEQLIHDLVILQKDISEYNEQWKTHHKVYRSAGLWSFDNPDYSGNVDELPYLPGTTPTDYALEHLIYPVNLLTKNVWGFIVCFVKLNKKGEVVWANAVASHSSYDLPEFKAEVLRIAYGMPAWVPGRKEGKAVDCSYYFAISFNPMAYKRKNKHP